jgi:diacylglycerol kinase family enzyme
MMRFVWPAVREFFTYWFHAPRFTITVDGEVLPSRCTSFVISNTRIYGGFMSVTPTASVLDGKLQVCSRRRPGVIANIMALIAALMWVKQPAILAKYAEGQVIEITTDRAIPLQIDGDNAPFELSPDKALTIRILPQRLRVLLPRDAPFTSKEKQV